MFVKRCILIKLCLVNCVAGIINVDYFSKNETQSKLRDLEVNINYTLNNMESKILDGILRYIDSKTKILNKNVTELEKMTQTLTTSNKKLEEKLEEITTQTLNVSSKTILDIEGKITKRLDALENTMKELALEKYRTALLLCKEVSVSSSEAYTPYYSVDTLNHVTLKRNSTGHLTYFETHIAIEADGYMAVRLSEKENDSSTDIRYHIDLNWGQNKQTSLHIRPHGEWKQHAQRAATPDILSSDQFRAFYVKIDDGKLEFGKEGGSSPIISYYDAQSVSVNYISFYYADSKVTAKIRYDCPAL